MLEQAVTLQPRCAWLARVQGQTLGVRACHPILGIIRTPHGTRVRLITLGLVILTLALVQRLSALVYEGGYLDPVGVMGWRRRCRLASPTQSSCVAGRMAGDSGGKQLPSAAEHWSERRSQAHGLDASLAAVRSSGGRRRPRLAWLGQCPDGQYDCNTLGVRDSHPDNQATVEPFRHATNGRMWLSFNIVPTTAFFGSS